MKRTEPHGHDGVVEMAPVRVIDDASGMEASRKVAQLKSTAIERS
jgi:hypothetical protein